MHEKVSDKGIFDYGTRTRNTLIFILICVFDYILFGFYVLLFMYLAFVEVYLRHLLAAGRRLKEAETTFYKQYFKI